MVRRFGSRNRVQRRLRRDPRCRRSHSARWWRCAWVSRLARHRLDWWRVNDDSAGTRTSATPSGRSGPEKRRGISAPPATATARRNAAIARSVRFMPFPVPLGSASGYQSFCRSSGSWEPSTLSLLVRPFNRSFEWCARGAGTWTAVAFTLFFGHTPPRSSARGEAALSVNVKRTMGLEPTTLGLGSQCSTN